MRLDDGQHSRGSIRWPQDPEMAEESPEAGGNQDRDRPGAEAICTMLGECQKDGFGGLRCPTDQVVDGGRFGVPAALDGPGQRMRCDIEERDHTAPVESLAGDDEQPASAYA
jgi:hypothetical protein